LSGAAGTHAGRCPRGAELWLALGAIAAGAALRLGPVGGAFLSGDELHTLRALAMGAERTLTSFGVTGAGMALPLLQLLLFETVGAGNWTARAPAWLPALAMLVLVHPIARRQIGGPAAAAATALAAVSPLLVFYAHFGRAYSLGAALCLAVLHQLEGVLAEGASRRRLAWLVVFTALAPFAHPTTAGFLLPVYAGTGVALLAAPGGAPARRRSDAARLALALCVAMLLGLLLHAPAWTSLRHFASEKTSTEYQGDFGPLDVAALLAGGRLAVWPWAAALAVGLWAWLRARGPRALPLACACLGPALALAAARPFGDAYAYARYVLPALVPACMVAAIGLRALLGGRRAPLLAGGALLAALAWIAGPLGPSRTDDGPYGNGYLSLQPLPSFDVPWPGAPAFYAELAARPAEERARLRIIEVPALATRARQYYRNLYLRHGVDTWLGFLPMELRTKLAGPYVSLADPDWLRRAAAGELEADYLVLHLDVGVEVAAYWDFVFGAASDPARDAGLGAYLERQRVYGGPLPRIPEAMVESLALWLGEPLSRQDGLAVWKLR
jgi:hypothetical protein